MECNRIHSLYPNGQAEEDDEEEDIGKYHRELVDWVEEQSILG